MATQIVPDYPLLTAIEFLEMDFAEHLVELDNGVIRVIANATDRHAQVAGNLVFLLLKLLRGKNYRTLPCGLVRTHDRSVRFPDVSVVHDRRDNEIDRLQPFDTPCVLFEMIANDTARTDLRVKLDEYKALDSVDTIVFVDIASERLRIIQRTAPHGWSDVAHDAPVDVELPALGVTVTHDEMFARD